MNTIKVEQIAVDEVRGCFDDCDRILAGVQTNDKTIAWDGHLYLFNDSSCRKDSYYAKIPVQVKGLSCLGKHPNSINYSIDISDLKAYKDEGIAFFVVYVNSNNHSRTVYYTLLAPIEIKAIISTCSGQNSKSVALQKLDCSNSDELDLLFRAFYDDCKRQKSFVDLPPLSFENLKKLGNLELKVFGFTSNEISNLPRALVKRDYYVYANLAKGSVSCIYPVGSSRCSFVVSRNIEKQVYVGNKAFFNNYSIITNRGRDVLSVGKCLTITMPSDNPEVLHVKVNFDISKYQLSEAIKELAFLTSLSAERRLTIAGCSLDMNQTDDKCNSVITGLAELVGLYDRLVKLKKALEVLHVKEDLELNLLKKGSEHLIDVLITAFAENKNVVETHDIDFYTEIGIGNVNVLLLATKVEDNTYHVEDLFHSQYVIQGSYNSNGIYPVTPYSILDKEKILKYSNIDYTQVLPSFIANKKENPDCFHLANRLGLFLLLAYDEQKDKDERLINTALDLFEWLRKEDIDELSNLSSKINILQIKKRLNLLNDEEKDELYDIAENVVSDDARFAAYLLLDEQKHALRYFNRLDANQQEFYRTLPIFHFIDNNAR